jgi:Ca-activated chloride channel family protein
MIQLAHPALLLLGGLLLLPFLVRPQRAWHYSSLGLLRGSQPSSRATQLTWGSTIIALSLLLIALARPQGRLSQLIQVQESRDIVLTLDLSLSMDGSIPAEAGKKVLSKLDVVQQAALEFVRRRQHDRLGLLIFGDETFGAWPLSTEISMLQQRLQHIQTLLPLNMRGTHVAKALEKSVDYLQAHGQAHTKIILLMTDGLDRLTAETVARLTQRLKHHQITLYVLGLNLPEASNILPLVRQTRGEYFDITDAAELDQALSAIDRLEASHVTWIQHTARRELYPFFVLPALLVLFVGTVLQSLWVVKV